MLQFGGFNRLLKKHFREPESCSYEIFTAGSLSLEFLYSLFTG